MSNLDILKAALPPEGQWLADALAAAADKYALDPTFLAGFPAWESHFGATLKPPFTMAGLGDKGHAVTPWQIDRRYHAAFLATPGAADPVAACDYVVANILIPALKRFGSENLDAVIACYNANPNRVAEAVASGQPAGSVTTPTRFGSPEQSGTYVDAVKYEIGVMTQRALAAGVQLVDGG